MSNYKNIRHGEIYLCNLGKGCGSVQGGLRPCLVLHGDNKKTEATVIQVIPITTKAKREEFHTHVKISKQSGLNEESTLLVEQITTINRSAVKRYLGRIDKDTLKNVYSSLVMLCNLSVRRYDGSRYAIIKTLCPKCRAAFEARQSIKEKLNDYDATEADFNKNHCLSNNDLQEGCEYDIDSISRFQKEREIERTKHQFVLMRVDPLQKEKYRCEVCFKEYGYDYFLLRKSDARMMKHIKES